MSRAVYSHPDGPSLTFSGNQLTARDATGKFVLLPIGPLGLLELAAELTALGKEAQCGIKNKRLSPVVHAFEFQTESWWGDSWMGDAPSSIEIESVNADVMPNAPMVAYLRPECSAKQAAAMLRDLAAYLDSDNLNLPALKLVPKTEVNRNDIDEAEKRRHALRVLSELDEQAAELRHSLFGDETIPF